MQWVGFALATAAFLALADFSVKLAAGRLSTSIGLLLYGATSFVTGLVWVLWERLRGEPLVLTPGTLLLGLAVGFTFMSVTIGLYLTFKAGAPVSVASPVIRLTGLLLVSVAGIALLREPLTARYLAGLLLAVTGVALIFTR